MDAHVFSAGDNVEFRRSGAWFPANVTSQGSEDMMVIEYKMSSIGRNGGDQRCVGAFSVADLRPEPPARWEELRIGEIVEVFRSSCWRRGELVGVSKDSRCLVRVDGVEEDLDVDRGDLRACLEWIDGAWSSPACDLKRKCEPGIETGEKKPKIKFTTKPLGSKFTPGERVEVRSDEAGFEGAWYAATIVGSMNSNNFLVEYETITTDDGTAPLRETAREEDIRPYPPEISAVEYSRQQHVDVWYNEGWWEGLVSNVIDNSTRAVYFASTDEELVYQNSCLRPHQDWVDGKWVAAAPESDVEKTNTTKETFDNIFNTGSSVEVRRDGENHEEAWYPAIILGSMPENNFLVELKNITIDQRNQNLREVVSSWDIRPETPQDPSVSHYELHQEVDVWRGGGWWEGMITNALSGDTYTVHLPYAARRLRCRHDMLRPHRDWIDGIWVASEGTIMDEAPGSTPAMHKTSPRKEFEASFRKGTEVEVKHNEEGLVGSWYCAVIDSPNGEGKYIVEYKTLRMEDDSGCLREVVDARDIRPSPPHVRVESFEPLQKVDAWYNEGWWEGVVLQVLEGSEYGVYFSCTDEEMEFDHEFLRPRQEWINGSWITAGKDHALLQRTQRVAFRSVNQRIRR